MTNREIQIGREYEELVIRRGTFSNGLVPHHHVVDWDDQPSRYKIYDNAERLPLAFHLPERLGSLVDATVATRSSGRRENLSYEDLSTVLLFSNGIMSRKVDVNWSLDHSSLVRHTLAMYARPTPSGGGMYPFEIYLVAGKDAPTPPGVYHYDNAHHALARLSRGDVSGRVRAATFGYASDAASYLLISLNFWKNYFKYHNFCYHVVTHDLGAVVGSVSLMLSALGIKSTTSQWFQDDILNRVVGLETNSESVFAVIALGSDGSRTLAAGAERERVVTEPSWTERGLNDKTYFQRSKKVFRLPAVERIHASTLIGENQELDAQAATLAQCPQILLETARKISLPAPTPGLLSKDIRQVLQSRSSSWGKMTNQPPLNLAQTSTLLRHLKTAKDYSCDVKAGADSLSFTRLMLFVNHVTGLAAGVYSYDEKLDCLWEIRAGDFSLELQEKYFLQNYNLEQASVVIAVIGGDEAFQAFGNRGLRIRNAEAGLLAHHAYLAAAAMSIDCGAALGFENVAVNNLLGLEETGQTALLLLLFGNQRAGHGRFDYRLI